MDTQEDNNRINFEDYCETSRKLALSQSSLFMDGFKSEKQSEKERTRRISLEIELVGDEIIAVNRPVYLENRNEAAQLYELFKSLGYLSNEEELDKLQRIMILSEEYMQLQLFLVNESLKKKTATSMRNDYTPAGTGDLEPEELAFHQMLNKINNRVTLVLPPSSIHDLSRIFSCHDWSKPIVFLYIACKTNELKCLIDCLKTFNPDLTYANIGRCGLFISKTGTPISAHDLATSSYKKLTSRSEIENIIAQYKKKH